MAEGAADAGVATVTASQLSKLAELADQQGGHRALNPGETTVANDHTATALLPDLSAQKYHPMLDQLSAESLSKLQRTFAVCDYVPPELVADVAAQVQPTAERAFVCLPDSGPIRAAERKGRSGLEWREPGQFKYNTA